MRFHKHHPSVGARPGTLVIPPDSPPPQIHLVHYDEAGVHESRAASPAGLAAHLAPGGVTWVDVGGLGDEAVVRALGEEFNLHPLALEDAVNAPQRAKSELYAHHQLIIARVPLFENGRVVGVPQVCFILGTNYLLTFQERRFGLFDPVRERVRAGIGPIRKLGPDYLMYALLDTLVDLYFPIAEELSLRLDELEDLVMEDPGPEILGEIHLLRRDITVLRRIGWPQREAISALVRDQTPFVHDEVRMFLRDTGDHMAQIVELIDSCREVATGVSEIYQSTVSQRTNEVMKVLTIMASIFIPLTFVAGIYGMNFEYMPELHAREGYFTVLVIMGLVVLGMLWYFRTRGWIGGGGKRVKRNGADKP
jgi:magnesium transporter